MMGCEWQIRNKKVEEGCVWKTSRGKVHCTWPHATSFAISLAPIIPSLVAPLSHSSLLFFCDTRLLLPFSIHVTFDPIVLFSANISIFCLNLLILSYKISNVVQWKTENSITNECMCKFQEKNYSCWRRHGWWWWFHSCWRWYIFGGDWS